MAITKTQLIDAFELRFDFASARAVFGQALEATRLADKRLYTTDEVAHICVFLSTKRHTRDLVQHLLQIAGLTLADAHARIASHAPTQTTTTAPTRASALAASPAPTYAPDFTALSQNLTSPWPIYSLLLVTGALATMLLIFAPWTLLAATPIVLGLLALMRLQAKAHRGLDAHVAEPHQHPAAEPHRIAITAEDDLTALLEEDPQRDLDDFDRRLEEAIQQTSKHTVAVHR